MDKEKTMKIEISKGRQYDPDGYRAKTSTHMWDGCAVVVDGETEIVIDGGKAPNALVGYDADDSLIAQFDIAALRVMTTGMSEIIEIATEARKPMTDTEHDAFDASRVAIKNAMTLNGTSL